MEELLNKLIKKGWKPFGKNAIKFDYDWIKTCCWYWAITYLYRDSYIDDYWDKVEYEEWQHQFNNRELVSKESWLWQFVCDKWLVKKDWDINKDMEKYMYKCEYMDWCWNTINYWKRSKFTHHYFYEYFIIESALCDEDKLEDFILDNVKIDEN
jgi:hypothetical protein